MATGNPFAACIAGVCLSMALHSAGAAQILVVEGETLVAAAKANAGKVAAQSMAEFGKGWSGGAQLLWSGGTTGAVLDLPISVPEGAVYAVEIYFARAPDYGQVSIEIDGKASPATFSGYAPRVAPPTPTQVGNFPLQAGTRRLSLMITGKAAQSSGYLVGLDQVKFYPAGALPGPAREARPTAPTAQAGVPARTTSPPPPQKSDGGGPAPAAPKSPGADCDSTCLGNVSSVFRKTEGGQCKLWFRIPCNPYGCETATGACRQACATDADCAQGSVCDTTKGMCAAMSTTCADNRAVRSANGQTQSCTPYSCVAGACMPYCFNQSDCDTGFSCEAPGGRCVKAPKKP